MTFRNRYIIRSLALLLSLNFAGHYSQVNQSIDYFPLKTGNTWVYSCSAIGGFCYCIKKTRYKITGSINLNSKVYYIFQKSEAILTCGGGGCIEILNPNDTIRVDSLTGNVYRYSVNGCSYSPNEITLDSLNSKLGDTVRIYCGVSQWRYKCTDTLNENIFGISRKTKGFNEVQFESYFGRKYAKGIGIVSFGNGGISCNSNSILRGCILDGVLFGDTSMLVGVNLISTEIPTEFSLSQNYPNPFNPMTKVKFDVMSNVKGQMSNVRLTVYDALGKEVEVLVNQQLSAGTYEVDFDGTNLPSGVYYYILESEEFTQSKKMVLIK
jgi:Secretion system C-terminal sorting domain